MPWAVTAGRRPRSSITLLGPERSMSRTILAIIGAGLVVIAVSVWATVPRPKKKTGSDPTAYRYSHCPQCHRESNYSLATIDKPCLYCDKALVPTAESIKVTGTSRNLYGRMLALILFEVDCVLGLIVLLSYRSMSAREVEYFYTGCPKCHRRIRYPAHAAGAEGTCPTCKTRFANPSEAEQALH